MAAGIRSEGETAGGDPWRIIFWAFPFETLPPSSRATAINQIVGWLGDLGDSTFTAGRRVTPAGGPEATQSYTLTLRAVGNSGSYSDPVVLTNTLPAELIIDPATISGGAVYDSQTRQLTWQGFIPAGGEWIIRYQATPVSGLPPGTQIDNQAVIYYRPQNLRFDRIATSWINAPDLSHSELATPELVYAGQNVLYQLVLQNTGLTAAQTTSVTLRLPDELGPITGTLQATGGSAVLNNHFLTWQGSLQTGQVITISIIMTSSFQTTPLWLPATAVISDNTTAPLVKDTLFLLIPYQSYFPAIAKN
jgi:uncharacterized repeat protein (TIGR01451 family)